MSRLALALGAGFLLAATASPAAAQQANACEALGAGTKFGDATVVSASVTPASADGLPSHCRILAIAKPKPSSHIVIEVALPQAEAWNGRLLGVGNGGSAGSIQPNALAGGLRRGFAMVTTDMGSYPAAMPNVGFEFGNGRPEALADWGHRSTHAMTVLAKALVAQYYGRPQERAYFEGCSTGGSQAWMEAQRYPDDYDAIIVGAPANNRTHLHTRFAALRKLGMQPGAGLTATQFKIFRAAALKACVGADGGAPGDTFLTNPLQCGVKPRDVLCKPGQDSSTCLQDAQVKALEAAYGGTRNPRTGELIYYGEVIGSEAELAYLWGDTPVARNFNVTHWVLPAHRASESFDFDRDLDQLDKRFAASVNAMNPDLSRFAARGGKVIVYHGLQDGLIPAADTIDFFQAVHARGRDTHDFARLFLVPGMGHCGGGMGVFGQSSILAQGPADSDLLVALDRWSTQGLAPEVVITRNAVDPAKPDAPISSRPLCAFPLSARYDGKGDAKQASSYSCRPLSRASVEHPAERYFR
ncbi:tannase/feruloyl esterase family alpha/beta hydrolase [Caulobacter radicis]|uniref:tannase/feruloyl esterase family alpha/beta hydrolase n=1 Tax=Caulobacter radicis TaxID=2172650 RepID=UPI001401C2EB|nr:tannase/feruloyl esterase family alpha/beta hydrolase [Caulobacter radicis]